MPYLTGKHTINYKSILGKTTLTSKLNRLEQSGYIIRIKAEKDKRKTLIILSEKIKSIEDRHAAVSKEMAALFYKGLAEEQIDEFEKSLQRILANLVRYEEDHK